MARPITFLSDYGYEDEFAGVCRGVIARLCPGAEVIDITHGIAPHDVRRGAFVLAAALPHCPPGIHLAVVDPGVGTARRPVAVAAGAAGADREQAGAGDTSSHVLVGPDNGLLWPALERLGGPRSAVELSRSPVRLEPVSATFHGRDLFAPVAAALARGAALAELGEAIDPATLARIEARPAQIRDDGLSAFVAYLDRFGNAVLELAGTEVPGDLFGLGDPVAVEVGGRSREAVFATTFADAAEGSTLLYTDATGRIAIAINRGSAARELGLKAGDEVVLRRGGEGSDGAAA